MSLRGTSGTKDAPQKDTRDRREGSREIEEDEGGGSGVRKHDLVDNATDVEAILLNSPSSNEPTLVGSRPTIENAFQGSGPGASEQPGSGIRTAKRSSLADIANPSVGPATRTMRTQPEESTTKSSWKNTVLQPSGKKLL